MQLIMQLLKEVSNMEDIITLDLQSRIPIYEQIIRAVERYVSLEILKPNEQIPSIRELASKLGINPNTVKKAYDELEQKNVIYALSTKGYFISDKTNELVERKIKEGINDIKRIISELENLGISKKDLIKKIN